MENAQNKLTKRNLWCYSVGTIGRDMAAAGLFIGHLLNYVLFTKALTAAQFTAISVIMVVARIFDAFNDPIMGNILDATRTRWGKFKPWILVGTVLTVIVVMISFSNTLQGWSYVILFGVLYFAFSITFTMNDIAYWGMLPSLATGADDRNRLTSITSLMAGIGAFLCGLIAPTFTAGERVIGGNAVTAYAVIAGVFCAIMLLTQAITLIGVKERPLMREKENAERTRVSLRMIISTIRGNDHVMWSAVIFFLYYLVTTTASTVSTSYLYFTFGYNGLFITLFIILGQAASAFLYAGFAAVSRRFTRKKLITFATFLSIGGYMLMLLSGLLMPNTLGMTKLAVMAVANLFSGVGNGIYYLVMMINIANAVEYNEWKHGKRSEGIIFSVRPFVTKLGMAIAQFLSMAIYLVVGVLGVTNQISEIENTAAQGLVTLAEKTSSIEGIIQRVPAGQTTALLLCLTLIPAAGILIAFVLYRRKITLDETRYAQIVSELEARA